jgi:hypothetical protein
MRVTVGQAALGVVDLVIAIGADNVYSFRYSTKEGDVTTPVDLTGWIARAAVKQSYDATSRLDLTQFIVLNAEPGRIDILLPASQTHGTTITSGVWDLELEDPDGGVIRFLQGRVVFSREVTT